MKLLQYEMKKLLFNKNRLILLSVFFLLYTAVGFVTALNAFELKNNDGYSKYMGLVSDNTGKINPQQLEESRKITEAAIVELGNGERLEMQQRRDPVLNFHFEYTKFGQGADEYWNGPKGIYPIQEKLKELEALNQTDTYEYRYYRKLLATQLSLGEPIFENIVFWKDFFIAFDGSRIVFLLMMTLAFFISPLFTQEIKTEMDSIVLCSVKGRREIVTAKLLCAGFTSAIIAAVFLTGSFIGTCIGYGDLSGFDAPLRCIGMYRSTTLNMTIGSAAALGAVWVILAAVVFGLALSFISSKTKNQSSAFGIGIVIILTFVFIGFLRHDFREMLWPLAYFNFVALSLFGSIFGVVRAYNVFGMPVSYGAVAFAACLALIAAACLLTYIAQKKRSAV